MAMHLKEYLKRYESGADSQKKKKKKREKPTSTSMGGVLVVDEDPVWQKPVQLVEDEESSGDEKPQIDEDIEVKRMKRLEAIRSRKPYHAISDDGSGWVSIPNLSKPSISEVTGPDLSPPRQRRARFDTPSPGRERKPTDPGDTDLSPPRQRRRRFDTPSPEPKAEGHGSGDLSPPRRRLREDISPPRQGRRRSSEVEASRGSPVPDIPPSQRVRRHTQDPAESRDSSAADLSPPRRSRRGSTAGLSPPRGTAHQGSADLSPPRRSRKGSSGDLSPPRRLNSPESLRTGEFPTNDLSPPRKRRNDPSLAKEERRTGLMSAKEIREENNRKKEESRFASIDPSSGRGATPVFRDKEGKRMSKEEILKSQEEEKPKEKKLEWGKGLAQKRDAENKALELELEKDKPFARTRDDPELDKMLKERVRWGDPMAHLVKGKHLDILEDLGDNEKMKESGFIVPQTIPSHSWIKRGLDFTPNRYGIRPGRHWDGVDRSNGYEKDLVKRQNDKRATETEAYLWSVSDM